MRLPAVCLPIAASSFLVGCGSDVPVEGGPRPDLFAARTARIHPVFTKILDWTGDDKPDGIEALIELNDRFGDPTKAAGTFTFELFEYRADQPDPRGRRLFNPWLGAAVTEDEQRERWSRTGRSYSFRLQAERLSFAGPYVFSVTFQPSDGGPRMFDRVVLGKPLERTPRTDERIQPADVPGTPPSSRDQRLPNEATTPVQ